MNPTFKFMFDWLFQPMSVLVAVNWSMLSTNVHVMDQYLHFGNDIALRY